MAVLAHERLHTKYELIVGLEIHAQLSTASKMFCRCSADYADAPPNTLVCPVCMGLPGSLPVINRRAVEYTIMTALALNCEIAEFTKFDRKNYPYPDLPKGYQISQYDLPLSRNGWLTIDVDGQQKRIGIRRVHLEEDTGKHLHITNEMGESYSLVDLNRSGVPLIEIVTEPDIRSAEEARLFCVKLRQILRYLGVSTGNMEEGALRCEPSVSIRRRGETTLSRTRVEIKNLNSFRAVQRAIEFEAHRLMELFEQGVTEITQETRGWDEAHGVTVPQRSKEFEADYRYFPDPDLPPMFISREWVAEIQARLPELPDAKHARFVEQYGLSVADATTLTSSRALADFYEAAVRTCNAPREVANWILSELLALLNARQMEIEASRVTPEYLGELVHLIRAGQISGRIAKEVLVESFNTGKRPADIVNEKGLLQISDVAELERVVQQVLEQNPKPVADYLSGQTKALAFLVGAVMKATRGKANPAVVNHLLTEELARRRGTGS